MIPRKRRARYWDLARQLCKENDVRFVGEWSFVWKMIDQYSADKEKLPSSLDDLDPDYIREVPIDPITGQKDWVVDMGEDTISRDGGTGVVDVHSAAAGESTDGTAYRDL